MKNTIKLEIHKAIKNKLFVISGEHPKVCVNLQTDVR